MAPGWAFAEQQGSSRCGIVSERRLGRRFCLGAATGSCARRKRWGAKAAGSAGSARGRGGREERREGRAGGGTRPEGSSAFAPGTCRPHVHSAFPGGRGQGETVLPPIARVARLARPHN